MATEFRDPGVEIDKQVGIAVELASHRFEVLGVVAEVGADEGGSRVPRDRPFEGVENLLTGGELFAKEEPVGVLVQLVPAFIEAVEGGEEGGRIGDVDHDGLPEIGRAHV